jgi:hypothetical protein
MSESERRIRRIAIGLAVVAMLTALLAVVVVVTRRSGRPAHGARVAVPARRHVSTRDLVRLSPETVQQAGEGVRVTDDALGTSLGLGRADTIVAISGVRVTDATRLPGVLRELGALTPSSLFVELVRDREPVLERWELDGDLEAARRADRTGAGGGGSRGGSSATPPLDPLVVTVKQLGRTTYEVPRATVDAWTADPRRIMAGGVTILTAGNGDGFQILAIQPGSIFEALGIENGDQIRAINGVKLGTTDTAIELIARSARQITVDLQRGGRAMMLNYLIK